MCKIFINEELNKTNKKEESNKNFSVISVKEKFKCASNGCNKVTKLEKL
jgi:hypothetical protein